MGLKKKPSHLPDITISEGVELYSEASLRRYEQKRLEDIDSLPVSGTCKERLRRAEKGSRWEL